jgi:hypothetical protein
VAHDVLHHVPFQALALGNPDLGSARLALPGAQREVETIGSLYSGSEVYEAVPSWECGDPPGTASPNDVGQSGGNADSGEQQDAVSISGH